MKFLFKMCEFQRRGGQYFDHGHPSHATYWSSPFVLEMFLREDVELVELDMCNFGMTSSDAEGEGLVRKRTKILINSPEVAKRVARRCSGDHRHVNLIGGRPRGLRYTLEHSVEHSVKQWPHRHVYTLSG